MRSIALIWQIWSQDIWPFLHTSEFLVWNLRSMARWVEIFLHSSRALLTNFIGIVGLCEKNQQEKILTFFFWPRKVVSVSVVGWGGLRGFTERRWPEGLTLDHSRDEVDKFLWLFFLLFLTSYFDMWFHSNDVQLSTLVNLDEYTNSMLFFRVISPSWDVLTLSLLRAPQKQKSSSMWTQNRAKNIKKKYIRHVVTKNIKIKVFDFDRWSLKSQGWNFLLFSFMFFVNNLQNCKLKKILFFFT